MIQPCKNLNEQQIVQLKRYLEEKFDLLDVLNSYIDEVEKYYEAELSPYYIGIQADMITGFLLLDEVEDACAYGRIFTTEKSFLREVETFFMESCINHLYLETLQSLPSKENLELDYAEYTMTLTQEELKQKQTMIMSMNHDKSIILHPMVENDLHFYENILQEQYDMSPEDALERAVSLLSENEMNGFLVKHNDDSVGVCSYYEGTSFLTLFDLTIRPEDQNLGYGKAMIGELIKLTQSKKKKYLLQVTSTNENAFHLYQQFGFVITEQMLFYEWNIA